MKVSRGAGLLEQARSPAIKHPLQRERPKLRLCRGLPSFGGLSKPAQRLVDTGRHTQAQQVATAETILRLTQAGARRLHEQRKCWRVQVLVGITLRQRKSRIRHAEDSKQAVEPEAGRGHVPILHTQH